MAEVVTALRLLAIGGAHIDRRGQVGVDYVPAASNPGTMAEEVGGGVFNALGNAVARGAAATLISVRGGDLAGARVEQAVAAAGIADLSSQFLDRATPSYTALLDRHGELIAALADMELYEFAFPRQMRRRQTRDAIEASDAVLCDANLPASALERLAGLTGAAPLHGIAISPAKVVRFAGVTGRLATLFCNRAEALALARIDGTADEAALVAGLRKAGLGRAVISRGAAPVLAFDANGAFTITPPVPRRIADVTGAGDALAGASVAALLKGLPFRDSLREGVAAALLSVESASAVPDYAAFADALALVPPAIPVA